LMRIWAAHLKNHEWTVLSDSGHAIAWEQPDVFNDKVLAFVKRY
jgi:pimeloyl-ACP methyl ester carboxylesterase